MLSLQTPNSPNTEVEVEGIIWQGLVRASMHDLSGVTGILPSVYIPSRLFVRCMTGLSVRCVWCDWLTTLCLYSKQSLRKEVYRK